MSKFKEYCDRLEDKIKATYEDGVTLPEAEKLAAEFLVAQMTVSRELSKAALDSRMRKQGVKSIRAALYTEARSKAEKTTEAAITALLDVNELVIGEQQAFDEAEVYSDELERLFKTFGDCHIYFRGLAKSGGF